VLTRSLAHSVPTSRHSWASRPCPTASTQSTTTHRTSHSTTFDRADHRSQVRIPQPARGVCRVGKAARGAQEVVRAEDSVYEGDRWADLEYVRPCLAFTRTDILQMANSVPSTPRPPTPLPMKSMNPGTSRSKTSSSSTTRLHAHRGVSGCGRISGSRGWYTSTRRARICGC
jgi:hypothetical protein